jgi:putative ubiquitin-RnfH superfamily antitoxin RatB of RatAB toxin-antitoxin module
MLSLNERKNLMVEKKQNIYKSPDITKLQEVVIDLKTSIYIPLDADPEEARNRYLERVNRKRTEG